MSKNITVTVYPEDGAVRLQERIDALYEQYLAKPTKEVIQQLTELTKKYNKEICPDSYNTSFRY